MAGWNETYGKREAEGLLDPLCAPAEVHDARFGTRPDALTVEALIPGDAALGFVGPVGHLFNLRVVAVRTLLGALHNASPGTPRLAGRV